MKINKLNKQKQSVKDFKGIDVNRALISLHGGSLEITLSVPLTVIPSDSFLN